MKAYFSIVLALTLVVMLAPQISFADSLDPGFDQGLAANGGPWEARWFNYTDPALVAAGYLPKWIVTTETGEKAPFEAPKWGQFLYINDPDKTAMSTVAFGQRLTLGADMIPSATFTIDFQCQCTRDPDRCPSVTMIIVPEAFWDEVPLMEPAPAGGGDSTNSIDLTVVPIWSQAIWNSTFTNPVGGDAEVWTRGEANVDELRAALADHAGETVVVGILFGCGHAGETETGMFDNFMFTGGAVTAVRSDDKLTTLWGAVKVEL